MGLPIGFFVPLKDQQPIRLLGQLVNVWFSIWSMILPRSSAV